MKNTDEFRKALEHKKLPLLVLDQKWHRLFAIHGKTDELNERIDAAEAELLELPQKMKQVNENLMILSMEYFYAKIKINTQESKEIEEWINQVRIDLKKNIIKKQNRDINNREIYAYLHDICGPQVLDLFDVEMEASDKKS